MISDCGTHVCKNRVVERVLSSVAEFQEGADSPLKNPRGCDRFRFVWKCKAIESLVTEFLNLHDLYCLYFKVNLGFLQFGRNSSKDGKKTGRWYRKENTFGRKENVWSKTHLNYMSWPPFLKMCDFPFLFLINSFDNIMRYVLVIFTPPPFLPPGLPPPRLPHPLNILCPDHHFTQGIQLVLLKSSWLWGQLWSMADLPGPCP